MKKSERDLMHRNIIEHGKNLLAIFPDAIIQDPVYLCKRLRFYELKAEASTTALCNGCIESLRDYHEQALERIESKVLKLLGLESCFLPFFINRDPRGYALKLSDTYVKDLRIYKDCGGYGILAPDFASNN